MSDIAGAVAIASLHDLDVLMANVALLNAERDQLAAQLNELPGVTAYDSASNFILFEFPPDKREVVAAALAERRIFIRQYSGALANCIRVSIGNPEENAIFLETIAHVLAPS